jgi:flagellar hook-associated protein 3 FlgL
MRINPDNRANLLYELSATQQQQNEALEQISSGRKIMLPSDDPAGMAALIQNRSSARNNDQFTQNLEAIKPVLQMADSALGSVVTGLQRAITLGVEGATGTLSESDRKSVAAELTGIRDNVLSLANSSYGGSYLFAGTAIKTLPFVTDPNSSSGIVYQGNANTVAISCSENRILASNMGGEAIFTSPNGDVFQALNDLITAMNNNDPAAASTANSDLRSAFDNVTSCRVFFGNALSQIEDDGAILANDKISLTEQENSIAGADPAESISSLLSAETARNATLAATGQVSKLSLLDYLN